MRRSGLIFVVAMLALSGVGLHLSAGSDAAQVNCSTALLVIDVQNLYVETINQTTADGGKLLEKLPTVLAAARLAGVPVIYIQQVDPRFPRESREVAIADAVAPHPGELVVWKTQQNAFWHTELADELTRLGVHRVLLAGLATQGCVNGTAFGALSLRYETWIVADAHMGIGASGAAYYNQLWADSGMTVIESAKIDFASLACSAPAAG